MGDAAVRASCGKSLERIATILKAHSTKQVALQEVRSYDQRASELMKKCDAAHFNLIAICKDDSAIEIQNQAMESIEVIFHFIRSKVQSITEDYARKAPPVPVAPQPVKLPPLGLTTFDGDFASWMSFKDSFLAGIGNNKSLSGVQKLQYLKASVPNEAAIKNITITEGNYIEAWKILDERYSNNREIVSSLARKMLDSKVLTKESPQELQQLLDVNTECLRALKVLNQPTEHWDTMVVAILVSKLDPTTKREWAIRQTGSLPATLEELTSFINSHIRGLLATGASSHSAFQGKQKGVKAHYSSSSSSPSCKICKESHHHHQCKELHSMKPAQRLDTVKKFHLCFNCLSGDHQISKCEGRRTCKKCGRRHHTIIHDGVSRQNHSSSQQSSSSGSSVATTVVKKEISPEQPSTSVESVTSSFSSVSGHVLLQTAIVNVLNHHGQPQPCRAFIDAGSEASFISTECADLLGLPRQRGNLRVMGIGGADGGCTKGKVVATLQSQQRGDIRIQMELQVMKKVTSDLPRIKCKAVDFAHLRGLQLADPTYHIPQRIDILIGADYQGQILLEGIRKGPLNSPTAQNTIFGWVLSGPATISSHHIAISQSDFHQEIRKFWEIEELPYRSFLTPEEEECENHFVRNLDRSPEGRYIVALPFNQNKEKLGESRSTAIRRWFQVEKRLQRQPQHLEAYTTFMEDYLAQNHMEEVPESEEREVIGKTYYLPHHFVINSSSTTTKLRVVFDGSATTSTGVSLNQALLVGATVQDDLYHILLRFRLNPIAIKADMAAMFRQFIVKKEDADFQRIVWRRSPKDKLREYRLTTVTYGTACAPFLATRCVKQLAQDSIERFPVASAALDKDTYVDDLMTTQKKTDQAKQLYADLNQVMDSAGLSLRKWASNNKEFLQIVPEDRREVDPHSFDQHNSIKALGVQWNPSSDSFLFKKREASTAASFTKRVLLSEISRVFDPLGLLAPLTVRAKLLFQELWELQIDWDGEVPVRIQQQWESYQEEMKNISSLHFPRQITGEDPCQYEIHGFSDASEVAYGAVVYLRNIQEDGHFQSQIITSKSRVAPLRKVSLPRLELLGAVLLAELVKEVSSALALKCKIHLWTDSTITLKWIQSQPNRWKTFIANRVARIQECTAVDSWHHVPGVENPADIVSRGTTLESLSSSTFWREGPSWLKQPDLPTFPFNFIEDEKKMEMKSPSSSSLVVPHVKLEMNFINKYSSFIKKQRVVAIILRFIFNCKRDNKNIRRKGPLQPLELENALLTCIRFVQQEYFYEDIASLLKTKEVKPSSNLRFLYPFIDRQGIMRLSGRLSNSHLEERSKHLIILPAKSQFVESLIHHHHQLSLHGGFQLTYSSIQSQYWIIGGRDKVRHFIRSCVRCRRFRAKAACQLMGQLPEVRVTPARPFIHTGVDFAGPFTLKNPIGRAPKTYKGYMCLFVCMVTKAIHLEAVSSLSTEDFIEAFRRFTSRRGNCTHMYSDRGTNFIGAAKEIQTIIASWESNSAVPDDLSKRGVTWHWSPASAPHFGGLFEAGVKSAKHHLRRVMGNAITTYEKFATLLAQMEAVLNSRPLHPISSDPQDYSALTPGHFLIGEPLLALPSSDVEGIQSNRLNLYQQQQQRIQEFWRRWSRDYLQSLQQRNKWYVEKDNLQVGDLILIVEDTAPGTWRMARVIQVFPGPDNKVRSVKLKTATTILERPIVKCIPLLRNNSN